MFESLMKFFKKTNKKEEKATNSKEAAKERLHLVLMQDRANVSADFLELMKQEIIEVIKKYIYVDENEIDVRLTNKENEDGTTGAPALYANIPIINIKNDARKTEKKEEEKNETIKEEKSKQKNQEKEEEKTENGQIENKEKTENNETEKNKQKTKTKEKVKSKK